MKKTSDIQDYLSRVDDIVARVESGETWGSLLQAAQDWLDFDRFNVANTLRHSTVYVAAYDRCVFALCSTPDVDVDYVTDKFATDRSCWNALSSNVMVPIWLDTGLLKETFHASIYLSLLASWRYVPRISNDSVDVDDKDAFLRVHKKICDEFSFGDKIDKWGAYNISKSLCDQGREAEVARAIQVLMNDLPIPENKQWHHMYEQIFAT